MSYSFFIRPLVILLVGFILTFLFRFISKRKHLLATLLRLEGLMLIIFGLFFWFRSIINLSNFVLIFLTLTACEGALGLSLLVSLVRTHGGDRFNSLNALQC